MNCQQVRAKLIELVYEELTGEDRSAVENHLRDCAACRAEYDALRLGRAAMALARRGQPGPMEWAAPVPRPAGRAYRHWLPAAVAAAAAVLVAVAVWTVQRRTARPAYAQPVEIRRLNVSLTILSAPEDWPRYWWPEGQVASWQSVRHGWPGMALVRDQRIVRRLAKGVTPIRFSDVPAGVLPDTVRLRSLDDPEGLVILEQNYQYDLASASAVLAKHIGKAVSVTFKDGATASGELLSFDDTTLVIRPDGQGPRNISRRQIRSVAFARLPEGLLTRPTLLWQLQNNAAADQQFEVAYLTHGLSWRADYVLNLRPADVAPQGKPPEIIDAADLVGYATVTNNSGVTYDRAQLKLLAGDVNLIRPAPPFLKGIQSERLFVNSREARAQFQEKSFFEYHLYTLTRRTTLRSAETKQIKLVAGSGLKLRRGYVYDRNVNPTAARVVSELVNSEENGLGKPLPKGVVRLYAPDPAGAATYVAQTSIDHTPKDEKLRLPWGYAFDIACSAKQVSFSRADTDFHLGWLYELRNHKGHDVTITVIARVPKTTYRAECNYPWHLRELGLAEIDVPVPANSAVKATFSYRYDTSRGGGLEPPHQRENGNWVSP